MSVGNSSLHHFILTCFNLLLWNKDKGGKPVRSRQWLEHRFDLFERYCLPSIVGQTCNDYIWIVLFDKTTPDEYKKKIDRYQKLCPQLVPVFVRPDSGRFFAQIFRDEVVKRLASNENDNHNENRVITTYLDNDDALNVRFVEDVRQRTAGVEQGTFIYYNSGCQLFTGHQYVMRICSPRNHFGSVVENADNALKTIYGYGSHYYIDKIEGVKIERVKGAPMWCEVIHEKNMDNDAYFLWGTKAIKEKDYLRTEFAIDETLNTCFGLYLFRFLPRYCKVFVRRIKYYFFGRHW